MGPRPPGNGERYRLTAIGPGVTPIVAVEFLGLPHYNRRDPSHVEHEKTMNSLGDQLAAGDQSRTPCRQH